MEDAPLVETAGTLRYDDKAIEAFAALEGNAHFQYLVECWIKRKYALAVQSTEQGADVQSRWTQGRSKEMADLVTHCKNARKNVELIRRNGGMR